jgi:hypothetical protein
VSKPPPAIAIPSPAQIYFTKAFTSKHLRAIDVSGRAERGPRRKKMTIFTIDNENSITAFATAEAAAAASSTPFDLFTDQKELAELLAGWPAERLVATYNSLPGVKPVKALKDPKTAASKIWERVEKLGQMIAPEPVAAKPEATPVKAKAAGKAKAGAQSAKGAPATAKPGKKTTTAKAATKGKKAAKQSKAAEAPKAARTGSKSEEVIAMLKRKNGATMAEIIAHTGWQKHTTRGWVSGFLGRKMGIEVESFKNDSGERTYRINK